MNLFRRKSPQRSTSDVTESHTTPVPGIGSESPFENPTAQLGKEELMPPGDLLGMETINEPENPDIDIVFVHGLTGGRRSTWTSDDGTFWPKELLEKDMPTARILSFGFDADIVKIWGMAGSNKIRDHAWALAYATADLRPTDLTRKRRLIYIAHSLGGLVVEQALLFCWKENDPAMNLILEATKAVVFMGTPHTGSTLAFWGRTVAKYLNIVRRTNKKIVELLEPRSEVLVSIEQDFQRMLLNKDVSINVFCFYEEQAVIGVGKIVADESAILPQYSCAPIHGSHVTMTKFANRDAVGYKSVLGRLRHLSISIPLESEAAVPTAAEGSEPGTNIKPTAGGHIYSGAVNSGGGQVFQGNTSATGPITFNFGIK